MRTARTPVRWVHISELPTHAVAVGRRAAADHRHPARLGRAASASSSGSWHRHLAGLGFGTGFDHESCPRRSWRRRPRLGFPVFEVPYELPFIAITEKAFARLVNEQYDVLQRGIAIHKRLERIVLEERGLDELVRALAAATGRAVRVLSAVGTRSPQAVPPPVPAAGARVADEVRRRSGRRAPPPPASEFAPDRWTRRALARAAGAIRGARRAAGLARRHARRRWPRGLRSPDPPAGGDGRRARADAPARDARHRAAAGGRRAGRGGDRAARPRRSSRRAAALRRGGAAPPRSCSRPRRRRARGGGGP